MKYCSVLAGGSNFDYTLKSKVVNLKLADDLLTSQTQVTQVWLLSMNLKGQVSTVRDLLPFSITYLNLANTLLHEFPTDLLSLPSLSSLYVGEAAVVFSFYFVLMNRYPAINFTRRYINMNYITSVNSSITSSKITDLYATGISLLTFLTYLYLVVLTYAGC